MENLIRGSVPTDTSSIKVWNSANAHVSSEPVYGYAYRINPGGFMAQFAYKDTIIDAVQVDIIFKNTSNKILYGEFVMTAKYVAENGPSASISLAFPPTDQYQTLSFLSEIGGLAITQYALELRNDASEGYLMFAQVALQGTLKSGESNSGISSQEFMDCAIMYGTDANKPKLR